MPDPTNETRAARALRALAAYKGTDRGAADIPERFIDLLTDLHHLMAKQKQKDICDLLDAWLRVAHDHYEAEAHGRDV